MWISNKKKTMDLILIEKRGYPMQESSQTFLYDLSLNSLTIFRISSISHFPEALIQMCKFLKQ